MAAVLRPLTPVMRRQQPLHSNPLPAHSRLAFFLFFFLILFFDGRPEAMKASSLRALSFINIFIELNKLPTFWRFNEWPGLHGKK